MKIKSTIIISFLILITTSIPAIGNLKESCEYKGDYETCKGLLSSGSSRGQDDLLCYPGTKQDDIIVYQLILDDVFSEIDEEVDNFLTNLEQGKEYYFGANKQKHVIEGVDNIIAHFRLNGYFYNKYEQACKNVIPKKMNSCFDEVSDDVAAYYLWNENSNNTCMKLAINKLHIFNQVGLDILTQNATAIKQDQRKEFFNNQRTRYSDLLDLMRDIVVYLERFRTGWPTKSSQ